MAIRISRAFRQFTLAWLLATSLFGAAHARNEEVLSPDGDFAPASPQAPGRPDSTARKVFRDRVAPHWFSGNNRFWYRLNFPSPASSSWTTGGPSDSAWETRPGAVPSTPTNARSSMRCPRMMPWNLRNPPKDAADDVARLPPKGAMAGGPRIGHPMAFGPGC